MTTKEVNNYVINIIKKYAWCMWMGILYGLLGVLPTDAIFWITYLPLIIFINISKRAFLEEKFKDIDRETHEPKTKTEDLNIFR